MRSLPRYLARLGDCPQGKRIAIARRAKSMTQDQLSELIGRSSGFLSQVETPSSVQPVSLKTLFAIADIFHVAPAKFLDFDNE